MATTKKKKAPSKDAQAVTAKVGDEFTYVESGTLVAVTKVHKEDGTVDVQEVEGDARYWGGVSADTDCLAKPAK